MAAKRYPIPKRFNAALSEAAYARLRELAARYALGNNYCLTVLLERLDSITDEERLRDWTRRTGKSAEDLAAWKREFTLSLESAEYPNLVAMAELVAGDRMNRRVQRERAGAGPLVEVARRGGG